MYSFGWFGRDGLLQPEVEFESKKIVEVVAYITLLTARPKCVM